MAGQSLAADVVLYILLGLMGIYALLVFGWQVAVLRGKPMTNPDGSRDDWHEQRTHYGIAVADVFSSCPLTLAGIALVFMAPRWGHFLLLMAAFWFVWANVMTTATSLRFERPKVTVEWFITFPLGALLGLGYIVWAASHLDVLFCA